MSEIRDRIAELVLANPVANLRQTAAEINAAIQLVAANAAAARDRITTLVTVEGGAEEENAAVAASLLAAVDAAETTKVAELEAEAVAIDAALEAAIEAFASAADSDTCTDAVDADGAADAGKAAAADGDATAKDAALRQVLMDRARGMQAAIQAQKQLPTGPVEPTGLSVVFLRESSVGLDPEPCAEVERDSAVPPTTVSPRLLHRAAIFAAQRVRGSFISFLRVPRHLRPGGSLQIEVGLTDEFWAKTRADPALAAPEAAAALDSLLRHVRVVASLDRPGQPQVLPLDVQYAAAPPAAGHGAGSASGGESCSCSIAIKLGTELTDIDDVIGQSSVLVEAASFAGEALPDFEPLRVPVFSARGMKAPLQIDAPSRVLYAQPAISRDGHLYILRDNEPLLEFGPEGGAPISSTPLAKLRMSQAGSDSVAVWDEGGALLLIDSGVRTLADSSTLVCVDLESKALRWKTPIPTPSFDLTGIAVLPAQGIVVESNGNSMTAHLLTDGTTVPIQRSRGFSSRYSSALYLACDPASGTVYCNNSHNVCAFQIVGFARDLTIQDIGQLAAADGTGTGNFRPMTVVPPGPGLTKSYLVVGAIFSAVLRVLSIPEHTLLFTYKLAHGMTVCGLAGDPSGLSLAVHHMGYPGHEQGAVEVMPWPLPGMPPLQ